LPVEREYQVNIIWNGNEIQMLRSAEIVDINPRMIGTQKRSLSGKTETLLNRYDYRVTLHWAALTPENFTELWTYWNEWGRFGRQAAITLDPILRDAGRWEVDFFNTHFSAAEIEGVEGFGTAPPRRNTAEWSRRYDITIEWRQGIPAE
jgi:hypothetical protein